VSRKGETGNRSYLRDSVSEEKRRVVRTIFSYGKSTYSYSNRVCTNVQILICFALTSGEFFVRLGITELHSKLFVMLQCIIDRSARKYSFFK